MHGRRLLSFAAPAVGLAVAFHLQAVTAPVHAADGTRSQHKTGGHSARAPSAVSEQRGLRAGRAEAQLIAAYKLVGSGRTRDALRAVDTLVAEHPNFRLALLLQGDLLAAQTRPLSRFADVPEPVAAARTKELEAFKAEALRRVDALREPPPDGRVPKEFVRLASSSRHAIAVDASRSRLYLFENQAKGIRVVANYYVSLGLAGTAKQVEGDQRTPLGVYFITSNLNPKSLGDLYGSGALPINYPNELDKHRGRTGSGIWLHGMPSDTFARPIQATDGCVALANPDLERLLTTVGVGTTPVLISQKLDWVEPQKLVDPRREFETVLEAWRQARIKGNESELQGFYMPGFRTGGKDRGQFARHLVSTEPPALPARAIQVADSVRLTRDRSPNDPEHRSGEFQMRDLSVLSWFDQQPHMIVTFSEVVKGSKGATIRRQYWQRDPSAPKGWRIYFEGVIG
jgi:hypothetical protein